MKRLYYHVSTDQAEGWAVSVDDVTPLKFKDKLKAIDAAMNAARELWDLYGIPSCVEVFGRRGRRSEAHLFGAV